jgi:hypothetical protein
VLWSSCRTPLENAAHSHLPVRLLSNRPASQWLLAWCARCPGILNWRAARLCHTALHLAGRRRTRTPAYTCSPAVSLPHSGFLLGVPGALGYLAGVLAVFATTTAVRWPSGAQESTRATARSFPPSLAMAGPAAATSSCKHQDSKKHNLSCQ